MASMSVPAEPTVWMPEAFRMPVKFSPEPSREDLVLELLVEAVAQEVVHQGADLPASPRPAW
jgi:hypothetical protein